MSRPLATAIGFSAVLLWSLLAALTAASGAMPPFQLTAVTFGIGIITTVIAIIITIVTIVAAMALLNQCGQLGSGIHDINGVTITCP